MTDNKIIKKIDAEHIAEIETTVHEQIINKADLLKRKEELENQIAAINEKLTYFE